MMLAISSPSVSCRREGQGVYCLRKCQLRLHMKKLNYNLFPFQEALAEYDRKGGHHKNKMAEKLLEENGHVSKDEEDAKKEELEGEMQAADIVDRTLMCGWGRWRPDCLQRFSTPKGFIIFLSLFAVSQGEKVTGSILFRNSFRPAAI